MTKCFSYIHVTSGVRAFITAWGIKARKKNVGQYCVGVEDAERKTKIFVEAEVKHSENELVARAWARKH